MAPRTSEVPPTRLFAASEGHILRGRRPPAVASDSIEAFPDLVGEAYRWSLGAERECGFLAYLEADGSRLQPEALSYGGRRDIHWHWSYPDAVVAASFHTHPTPDAACMPSGLDLLGAMVRGDHVHYVLTMDGRLTGWRFRGSRSEARAVHDAIKCLSDAGKLRRPFVAYLQQAFGATTRGLVEPVYGARLDLDGKGVRFRRCDLDVLLTTERWVSGNGF